MLSRGDALKNLKLKACLNETGPKFIHKTQVYQYICMDRRLKIEDSWETLSGLRNRLSLEFINLAKVYKLDWLDGRLKIEETWETLDRNFQSLKLISAVRVWFVASVNMCTIQVLAHTYMTSWKECFYNVWLKLHCCLGITLQRCLILCSIVYCKILLYTTRYC